MMSDDKENVPAAAASISNATPRTTSHRASPLSHSIDSTTPRIVKAKPSQDEGAGANNSNSNSNKLLFLNYSNPSEFKSRSNKRIVKRWASTSTHRSSQPQEWDSSLQRPGSPSSVVGDSQRKVRSAVEQLPDSAYASRGSSATSARASVASLLRQESSSSGQKRLPPNAAYSSDVTAGHSSSDQAVVAKKDKQPKRKRRTSKKPSSSGSEEPRPLRKILPASAHELSATPSPVLEAAFRDPFDVLPAKKIGRAHV